MYYSCNEWLYLQLSDPFTISHEYTWQIPGVHNLTFTHHFLIWQKFQMLLLAIIQGSGPE